MEMLPKSMAMAAAGLVAQKTAGRVVEQRAQRERAAPERHKGREAVHAGVAPCEAGGGAQLALRPAPGAQGPYLHAPRAVGMDEIALPQAGRKAHIGPYGHVGGLPGGQHKGRAGLQRAAQDVGAAEGDGAFRRRFAPLHTAAQPQTRLDGAAVRSGQKAQAGEVQPGRAGFVRVGGVRQKGAQPGRERGHGITGARASATRQAVLSVSSAKGGGPSSRRSASESGASTSAVSSMPSASPSRAQRAAGRPSSG